MKILRLESAYVNAGYIIEDGKAVIKDRQRNVISSMTIEEAMKKFEKSIIFKAYGWLSAYIYDNETKEIEYIIKPKKKKKGLFVKRKDTGEIIQVRKYIIEPDSKNESIWSNEWYGRHVIGMDCEWYKLNDKLL